MHTPRIFTTPVMSGYAYSGLSSTEYKDSLCRAITSGVMLYDECLKVLRECMLELRSTFNEIRGLDSAFEEGAHGIESIVRDLHSESVLSARAKAREQVLYGLTYQLCDVLYGCATAACNQDVARFIDPDFCRRSAHLQIAKACGILVNSIVIVNCLIKTITMQSASVVGKRDDCGALRAVLALSAYVNVQFSAFSRCLNSCPGPEETRSRKAILRVLRHNMELCNKVSELISPDMLYSIRICTERTLKRILSSAACSSATCEEMVSDDKSARKHLVVARKAQACLAHHLWGYVQGYASETRLTPKYSKQGGYVGALVPTIGALFLMYRGYASTGNAERVVASKIEYCLRILLALPSPRQNLGAYKARKIYVDMCSVHEDLEQNLRPELLLNPGAEVKLRDAALGYLSEMMEIWEGEYGRYFNAVEQTGGSPSQPSTSGLGSTSAGMGGSQTPYMPPHDPGMMPYSYAQPSTSWDQPSTSGLGGAAGLGSRQASHIPPHDPGIVPHAYAQPSTSYAQPSTSGLGSTAGVGSTQVSYMPPHDPGIVPHAYAQPSTSYAQPSTSGLGSTAGVGSTQVSYMPPHDPGIVPHAYAQPSTSYAQPSTSGLGSTAGVGSTQVSYMPPHDPGIVPHAYAQPSTSYAHPSTLWDQPSTSGLGGASTGVGRAQAPHMPPQDPGIVPHAYAQPSTSCAHPSTSGLGSTNTGVGGQQAYSTQLPELTGIDMENILSPLSQSSTSTDSSFEFELEEAIVTYCQQQTPDDDEDEQPSKRARYR